MMFVVVVVFSLCWAPWQAYLLAAIVHPAVNTWKYVNIMFFIFHWLAMSNSCYNPFIYGIYSVGLILLLLSFFSSFDTFIMNDFRRNSSVSFVFALPSAVH